MGLFGFGKKKGVEKVEEVVVDDRPRIKPKNLKDSDMESIIKNSDKPVMVDCWASWCQPCKMIAPIIADLANEYRDDILVAKLNTEKNRKMAAKFGVRSLPTILYFKDGKLITRTVGAIPKQAMKKVIDTTLLKKD